MHLQDPLATCLLVLTLAAAGRSAEVKNLKVGQVGDKAVATYDLVAEKGEKKAEVTVSISINGQVRTSDQLHLTGALGNGVQVGKGKKVTWDVTKDLPSDFDWDKAEFNWNVVVPSMAKAKGVVASQAKEIAAGTIDRVDLGNGLQLELVMIPAGDFMMGTSATPWQPWDQHKVIISRGFWMGKYDVTQAQWEAEMGSNPSSFKGADYPVEEVSWDDCQQFISRLNATGHGTFRL